MRLYSKERTLEMETAIFEQEMGEDFSVTSGVILHGLNKVRERDSTPYLQSHVLDVGLFQ